MQGGILPAKGDLFPAQNADQQMNDSLANRRTQSSIDNRTLLIASLLTDLTKDCDRNATMITQSASRFQKLKSSYENVQIGLNRFTQRTVDINRR